MYRSAPTRGGVRRKSPHKRGDVPQDGRTDSGSTGISPQAWGCTVHSNGRVAPRDNLPTSVGMYRREPP